MIRYIDLFSGIGGFRIAAENVFKNYGLNGICVFSSDIDSYAQQSYQANFGEFPFGDITKIDEKDIPDHDILFAGFPCQPFSIIGKGKGFDDIRGTLFFDIARILKEKKPSAFILENVKQLTTHDEGKTFGRIREVLSELGYHHDFRVLNALDYGLPQKRERVIIVGFKKTIEFKWPEKSTNYLSLSELLESDVKEKHFASEYIKNKRRQVHQSKYHPSIWHENKGGNVSSYPYSCALRANASYNYLLVNGERRLTPREMLRLQGFPDFYKIVVPDTQIRKQAGNAVPVNIIQAVFNEMIVSMIKSELIRKSIEEKNNVRQFTSALTKCR